MNFGDALAALKTGSRVTRESWMMEKLLEMNNSPTIYLVSGEVAYWWGPEQDDLLAEDWSILVG